MSKRIVTVGTKLLGKDAEYISFDSDRSLLDADLVIFKPDFEDSYSVSQGFQGKPLLTEAASFEITDSASHWRSELQTALDAGKTVIIFLSSLEDIFVYTGTRTTSGTGRNQQTTLHVTPFNNYRALPIDLGPIIPKGGEEIRLVGDSKLIASYWREFGAVSAYAVYLDRELPGTILTTKTGSKTVGAVINRGKGTMVLLPSLNDPPVNKRTEFGKRLSSALIEIDRSIRQGRDATPAPSWVEDSGYRLEVEAGLEQEIKKVTADIEALQNTRSELTLRLEEEGGIRRLLYETGKQLEQSIISALNLLGYKAEPFVDAESEFDAVFTSPEGRFLGEVEGKDNKAINIDKLSQLERNLQEDFAKEGVSEYAKGVLFGNAFRLTKPEDRGEFFTEKCKSGAKRSGVALVRTTDLFHVAKYLREHPDPDFARLCREAIFNANGDVVVFPAVPATVAEAITESLQEVPEGVTNGPPAST